MSTEGKIVVFSGPSGVGKTTVVREAMSRCRRPLVLSVSATTRPPRPGEVDGVDYHFLSPEEFERRRRDGQFLEHCEVFGGGCWYGTLIEEVTPSLKVGKWVVLEIDVKGTRAVLERFPSAVTIFVEPPSLDELERRLLARATESESAVRRRLEVAKRELEGADQYQHRVVNDDRSRAVQEICDILNQAGE
jgi:guanylate kinase